MTRTVPYRPSNGTDGVIFESFFCDRCAHDNFDENTGEGGCPILASAHAYRITEPGYPTEWVRDADDTDCETARCTKFTPR